MLVYDQYIYPEKPDIDDDIVVSVSYKHLLLIFHQASDLPAHEYYFTMLDFYFQQRKTDTKKKGSVFVTGHGVNSNPFSA